ncbi:MAG: DUF362 domain-containing protein [Candidatus Eisenbacteria sp.]|nr:DUF362 domain-containing protein [Candidatus Eisenbacteria bacterium]
MTESMNRRTIMQRIAARGTARYSRRRVGETCPLSRRRFLHHAALGSAGLLFADDLLRVPFARAAQRTSKVVRTYHADATTGAAVNQEPVDSMVHVAVCELTGIGDPGAAWKSLFPGIDASKHIAIKINLACGDVPTHPEVVNAIVDGLLMMDLDGQQLPQDQIIVWDHDDEFFCYPDQNGYDQNYGGPGVQYYGTTHPSVGFDSSETFSIRHGTFSYTYHQVSKIISQHCDYMINAAVIKDHSDAEITLCMKNNYGSFSGVSDGRMHSSGHDLGEPELNKFLRDDLGDKTKLFLIDGTLGIYAGGPGYVPPGHTPPNWAYNSLLVSQDLVAIDRIGTIKTNEERLARMGPGNDVDPTYLAVAAGDPYYLGTDDPEQIELVEIDVAAQNIHSQPRGTLPFTLLTPYPNPAPGRATLRFHTSVPAQAKLLIVDATGSLVRRLAAGKFSRGMHRIRWDGRDQQGLGVASGTYFCRLEAAGRVLQQRLVLLR